MTLPFEIGVRGYMSKRNREIIMFLSHTCNVRNPKYLTKMLGKLAIMGSYQIYLARNSQSCSSGGLLKARNHHGFANL